MPRKAHFSVARKRILCMQIIISIPSPGFSPETVEIQSSLCHVSKTNLCPSFRIIYHKRLHLCMGVTRIIRPSPYVMDMEIYNLIAPLNNKSFSGYVKTQSG